VYYGARDRKLDNVYREYPYIEFLSGKEFVEKIEEEESFISLLSEVKEKQGGRLRKKGVSNIDDYLSTILEIWKAFSKERIKELEKNLNELKFIRDIGITQSIVDIAKRYKFYLSFLEEDTIPNIYESDLCFKEKDFKDPDNWYIVRDQYFNRLVKDILDSSNSDLSEIELNNYALFILDRDCESYFVDDMKRYYYISDVGSPMVGDKFYFNKHPEWFDFRGYPIYIEVEGNKRKIILGKNEITKKKILSRAFQNSLKWTKSMLSMFIPEREFLGSSYKPKATKELLKKAVIEGKTDEEIFEMFRDVNPRQLAAIKAHKTIGTYEE
jgi:hypothetical protein